MNLQKLDALRKKVYGSNHFMLFLFAGLGLFFLMCIGIVFLIQHSENLAGAIETLEGPLALVGIVLFLIIGFKVTRGKPKKSKREDYFEQYINTCLREMVGEFQMNEIQVLEGFDPDILSGLRVYRKLTTLSHISGNWHAQPFELGELTFNNNIQQPISDNSRDEPDRKGTFFTISLSINLREPLHIQSRPQKESSKLLTSFADGLLKGLNIEKVEEVPYGTSIFRKRFQLFTEQPENLPELLTEDTQTRLLRLAISYNTDFVFSDHNFSFFIEDAEFLIPKNTELTTEFLHKQQAFFYELSLLLKAIQISD